jgi:hypothetical protein
VGDRAHLLDPGGELLPAVALRVDLHGHDHLQRPAVLGGDRAEDLAGDVLTAAGLLAGNLVGDPERLGLDAAFPALFLALVVPQLRTRSRLAAALAGAGLAVVLTPLTGPGVPVVAASLACLAGVGRR